MRKQNGRLRGLRWTALGVWVVGGWLCGVGAARADGPWGIPPLKPITVIPEPLEFPPPGCGAWAPGGEVPVGVVPVGSEDPGPWIRARWMTRARPERGKRRESGGERGVSPVIRER